MTPDQAQQNERSNASSINVAVYVAGVIFLALGTVAAVILLPILIPLAVDRPSPATIIGVTAPIILGLLALIQSENHKQMNSRLDQITAFTRREARSEGVSEGAAAERASPTAPTVDLPALIQAAVAAALTAQAPTKVEVVNPDPVPVVLKDPPDPEPPP